MPFAILRQAGSPIGVGFFSRCPLQVLVNAIAGQHPQAVSFAEELDEPVVRIEKLYAAGWRLAKTLILLNRRVVVDLDQSAHFVDTRPGECRAKPAVETPQDPGRDLGAYLHVIESLADTLLYYSFPFLPSLFQNARLADFLFTRPSDSPKGAVMQQRRSKNRKPVGIRCSFANQNPAERICDVSWVVDRADLVAVYEVREDHHEQTRKCFRHLSAPEIADAPDRRPENQSCV